MKIAVIGSSGEIGSRLAIHLLNNKCDVKLLSRNIGIRLVRYANLDYHSIDLADIDKLKSFLQAVDCVINCAIDKQEYGSEDESVLKNKKAIQNLLEAAEESGVKKFIELSSIAVLPPLVTQNVLDNPFVYSSESDWYTRAKIENEKLALQRDSTMEIKVIRAGIVYGPYLHWSKLAFTRTQNRMVVLTKVENSVCHAIHVDDLVGLINFVVDADSETLPNLIYGINPEIITWKDYFEFHGQQITNEKSVTVMLPLEEIKLMNKIDGDELRLPGFKRSLIDSFRKTYNALPGFIVNSRLLKSWTYRLKAMNYGMLNYQNYLNPKRQILNPRFYPNDFEIDLFQSNAMPKQNIAYQFKINLKDGTKSAAKWWLKSVNR